MERFRLIRNRWVGLPSTFVFRSNQSTSFNVRLAETSFPYDSSSPGESDNRVRREKAVVHSGSNPPGNWFAPPGSNQSSGGGNETAEASGAESRKATWRA